MLNTIKTLLLDFQETPLHTGVPRALHIQPVAGKAAVCIGVRRCGKSTLLFQIIERLLKNKIPITNILYLNFFDDRLHPLRQGGLDVILEAYYALFPHKKGAETVYCFFDEIQMSPGWESFIERLLRTEKCQVYITGSSAQMLSKEIATQMRGRALSWELFPFSFDEYLDRQNIQHVGHFSSKTKLFIQNAFEVYWRTGGFPEVIGLDGDLQRKIHQEYFQSVVFRDCVERYDIAHPKAVLDLAYRLIDNLGSLYSLNKLSGYLQSIGHKVSKSAVADYLAWFEDAYFLFTLYRFDASIQRRKSNAKKIYCIDHALATSISAGILVNSGHLLENLVFVTLRRTHAEVFYYKTQRGREVDFIALTPDRRKTLVQVCESMAADETREREVRAISEAMMELEMEHAIIVTRNEQTRIETAAGVIEVLPIWRFLLTC